MSQIAEGLRALPLTARRSVTFDRGSEFVDWPHLQAKLAPARGSAIRNRHDKKAALKMRTNGSGALSAVTPTPRPSRKTICVPSAPV
jgi:hypothetical protein